MYFWIKQQFYENFLFYLTILLLICLRCWRIAFSSLNKNSYKMFCVLFGSSFPFMFLKNLFRGNILSLHKMCCLLFNSSFCYFPTASTLNEPGLWLFTRCLVFYLATQFFMLVNKCFSLFWVKVILPYKMSFSCYLAIHFLIVLKDYLYLLRPRIIIIYKIFCLLCGSSTSYVTKELLMLRVLILYKISFSYYLALLFFVIEKLILTWSGNYSYSLQNALSVIWLINLCYSRIAFTFLEQRIRIRIKCFVCYLDR